MSLPCYDPMDDPDDDPWGWGEEEGDWRGDEHPEPLPVEWGSIEYLAGPEYRFYKKLSETRWALTPLGEAIRHEVQWPETQTRSVFGGIDDFRAGRRVVIDPCTLKSE